MRWLVASAVVVGVAAAPAASAGALGSRLTRPPVVVSVTGRVSELDLSAVRVGRVSCSFTARSAALAQQFDVGENVTIVCVRGVLTKIRLQPLTGGHASSAPLIVASLQGGRPSASPGAPAAGPTTSASAQGPISALTATSITVGGVTCPFSADAPIAAQLQVGDFVTISCGTDASGSFSNVAT